MLPYEKPVDRALAVFIDPPEFILDLKEGDVFPGPDGKLELRVRIRGATEMHWVKNDIALREGADGGRILGVTTSELKFTHLLGRDKDQKVWCIASNKWGTISSAKVQLRTEANKRPAGLFRQKTKVIGGTAPDDVEPTVEPAAAKEGHKKTFGASLKDLLGGKSVKSTKAKSVKVVVDDETESEREERERVTSVEARVWSGDI